MKCHRRNSEMISSVDELETATKLFREWSFRQLYSFVSDLSFYKGFWIFDGSFGLSGMDADILQPFLEVPLLMMILK